MLGQEEMIHSKGAAERRRSLALENLNIPRGNGKLKVDGEKREAQNKVS